MIIIYYTPIISLQLNIQEKADSLRAEADAVVALPTPVPDVSVWHVSHGPQNISDIYLSQWTVQWIIFAVIF